MNFTLILLTCERTRNCALNCTENPFEGHMMHYQADELVEIQLYILQSIQFSNGIFVLTSI